MYTSRIFNEIVKAHEALIGRSSFGCGCVRLCFAKFVVKILSTLNLCRNKRLSIKSKKCGIAYILFDILYTFEVRECNKSSHKAEKVQLGK